MIAEINFLFRSIMYEIVFSFVFAFRKSIQMVLKSGRWIINGVMSKCVQSLYNRNGNTFSFKYFSYLDFDFFFTPFWNWCCIFYVFIGISWNRIWFDLIRWGLFKLETILVWILFKSALRNDQLHAAVIYAN